MAILESYGKEGNSCNACIYETKARGIFGKDILKSFDLDPIELVCSVCDGIGKAQIRTNKMNSRARFRLALWIIIPLFLLIFLLKDSEHFNLFLTFASTLIGGITGFYYAQKDN